MECYGFGKAQPKVLASWPATMFSISFPGSNAASFHRVDPKVGEKGVNSWHQEELQIAVNMYSSPRY